MHTHNRDMKPSIGRGLRTSMAVATALLLLSACASDKIGGFEASVDPALMPKQPSVPDASGNLQSVAVSRDAQGIESDFVERIVVVRPGSDATLQDFLSRYNGMVISDNTVPAPPPERGITLTAEQRKPTEFVVQVDLAGADLDGLAANARLEGLREPMTFSSEAGLRTFARVLEARAAGFEAALDHVTEPQQAFPQTIFTSVERAGTDAFTDQRYSTTSNQTNVALAWQFLLAHGIQQRVEVAIIDSGFWLDTQGRARGADSDFVPAPAVPVQYDFVQDDRIADGPNAQPCAATNPCFWHGTGAAGVATGIMNNNLGHAGTGSPIATPILLKQSGTRTNRNWAVRTAVAWGAHVVSMSFGGDCNQACRIYDRDHTPFADAVNAGSRVVFVAAAGNGRGTPAAGYDVGGPNFRHPCIEDHVICVGAVQETPSALTPTAFSNFGARVTVFAPTNLTVMSYPQSIGPTGPLPIAQAFGPEQPQTFGGTSASTPFVAGVAAMMKAINPNLNSDDVARILAETARLGVGNASRVIDALAAVRKAAEGIPMVNDRFEDNSLESNPTNLSAAPPHVQQDLNINGGDRDYFTFSAPGGSTAIINLSHVEALGPVSVLAFDSLGANCDAPTLVSDVPLVAPNPLAPGRSLTFTVPGGPLRLGLKGTDVNAYDLNIAFATRTFTPDFYEVNDTVTQARYLYSWKFHPGPIGGLGIDPRATIDANIHSATDVDYYIVRGARITVPEQVFLVGSAAVRLYGNESPVNLQVFQLNPDNTQGALVANVGGGSCATEPLEVRLTADAYYLVRVSGSTGNYTLSNGVFGDKRRFPMLVHDQIYEVLHPGEPVEHAVGEPKIYVFTADPIYQAVRTPDPRAHMRLLDQEGRVVAEGAADEMGERLSLANITPNGIYGIAIRPEDVAEQPPILALQWEQQSPARVSENLVRNPGAETTSSEVGGWRASDDRMAAQVLAYGVEENRPSHADPGPQDRGAYLFAGAPHERTSGLRQEIAIDPAWREAIDRDVIRANFSAYLGGYLREGDLAVANLTFLGEDMRPLGQIALSSVGPRERSGKTGLWPVAESAPVPRGTVALMVDLMFTRVDGRLNDSYADNVSVTLSEY
jgi:subtilisin family serine protease